MTMAVLQGIEIHLTFDGHRLPGINHNHRGLTKHVKATTGANTVITIRTQGVNFAAMGVHLLRNLP